MSDARYPSGDTSNDVLIRLEAEHSTNSLSYRIVAQSDLDVRDLQNAPSISMSHYITDSDQAKLLTTVSIYSQRGENSDQMPLLYMNDVAFFVWKKMGKKPNVIGSKFRPPSTASLSFGVPFTELHFDCSGRKVSRLSMRDTSRCQSIASITLESRPFSLTSVGPRGVQPDRPAWQSDSSARPKAAFSASEASRPLARQTSTIPCPPPIADGSTTRPSGLHPRCFSIRGDKQETPKAVFHAR
jgi:hypothetical protein